MHPSIYSSSRIASSRLFPYLAIPPRYSSANALTSVFQKWFFQIILPVSTTQSPHLRHSVCLNYSQTSSELYSQTWWPGENKLVSAHYIRESQGHSYLEHKAGVKCMRALQVLWSELVITGTAQRCTDKCSLESRDSLLGATYHVPQISPKISLTALFLQEVLLETISSFHIFKIGFNHWK